MEQRSANRMAAEEFAAAATATQDDGAPAMPQHGPRSPLPRWHRCLPAIGLLGFASGSHLY